jgi:hypothetical protein
LAVLDIGLCRNRLQIHFIRAAQHSFKGGATQYLLPGHDKIQPLYDTELEGTAITGQDQGLLLTITELGGYPDFAPIYRRHGFKVETATSVRNATRLMKKIIPRVIVAEFNYQSDFRDRTSSLETLMAVLQRMPTTQVIVFYEQEYSHQLERLTSRFPIQAALPFPIDELALEKALRAIEET